MRDVDITMHSNVKPVALMTNAIFECSSAKGVMLDAVSNPGTRRSLPPKRPDVALRQRTPPDLLREHPRAPKNW
jgi:hypothetical protein